VLTSRAELQALHWKKILHRDIKPGNMMVAKDNLLKIGDLGIGKVLKNRLARTAIGTPHYMAPEGTDPTSQHHFCSITTSAVRV
jgi:serine/threonine protein kinase